MVCPLGSRPECTVEAMGKRDLRCHGIVVMANVLESDCA